MKEYLRVRTKQEKTANLIGLAVAVAIHASALLFCSFTGLKYLYPPPEETSILLDFSELDDEVAPPVRYGNQPRAEEADLTRPIELVQRSQSPYQATTARNETPATRPDAFGDVEVPEVEQEDALDPRAAFPGMSKRDSSYTAPHSADDVSNTYKAGQPKGNTDKGDVTGAPNVHLKGRSAVGNLPRPSYSIQKEGRVVVEITVDQYGKVTQAQAGADGTTVTDQTLWAAARAAAMQSHFNKSGDAPVLQKGTITYEFKLK